MTTRDMLDGIHQDTLDRMSTSELVQAFADVRIAQLAAQETLSARIARIELRELTEGLAS